MTTRPTYYNPLSGGVGGGGGGGPVPAWGLEHIQGRGPGGLGDGPLIIAPAVIYDPTKEYLLGIVQTSAPSGDSTQAQILAAGGFYFAPLWLPSPRLEADVFIPNQINVVDNWGNIYSQMGGITGGPNFGCHCFVSGQEILIPPAAANGRVGCTLLHTPSPNVSSLFLDQTGGLPGFFNGFYRGSATTEAAIFFILSRSAAR